MKLRHFLFFLGLCLVVAPGVGVAVDYTASRSSSDKSDTQDNVNKTPAELCTKQDMKLINKFDPVAKKQMEKYNELLNSRPEMDDSLKKKMINTPAQIDKVKNDFQDFEKEIKAYQRKLEKAAAFFETEEYDSMKPVYARCNIEMPAI